eukprot:3677817-Amphidinium_carterae.1
MRTALLERVPSINAEEVEFDRKQGIIYVGDERVCRRTGADLHGPWATSHPALTRLGLTDLQIEEVTRAMQKAADDAQAAFAPRADS